MFASTFACPTRASGWLRGLALLSLIAVANPVAAAPKAPGNAPESPASAASSGVVNLNTATEAELLRLPGVGPAKAQAILALREQLKGFHKLEDLMRVKGIGRKSFRDLQPMLTLQGPTTLTEQSASKTRS
jgi:competence protein ComEA